MPRRPKVGGKRPGSGAKPQRGTAATITRSLKLTQAEADAHDAARGERGWSDWMRAAAAEAIARGATPR